VPGVLRWQRLEDPLSWSFPAKKEGGTKAMEWLDHIVKIVEQVGFPAALVLVMIVLAPRYALRLLEVFRKIMDEFADKLVSGIRQVVERHEAVVNRAEAITSRQEAAVSRLESISQIRWRNGGNGDG
jgi:hypothetical protein